MEFIQRRVLKVFFVIGPFCAAIVLASLSTARPSAFHPAPAGPPLRPAKIDSSALYITSGGVFPNSVGELTDKGKELLMFPLAWANGITYDSMLHQLYASSYAADSNGDFRSVSVFRRDGTLLRSHAFPDPGCPSCYALGISSITYDDSGRFYAAAQAGAGPLLLLFDRSFDVITMAPGSNGFQLAWDDDDSELFETNINGEIVAYSRNLNVNAVWTNAPVSQGLVYNPQTRLLYATLPKGGIVAYTTEGVLTQLEGTFPGVGVAGQMTVDPDGNLFIVEPSQGLIGVYDSQGRVLDKPFSTQFIGSIIDVPRK